VSDVSINKIIDAYFAFEKQILDYAEYTPQWQVFPFDDKREMWWAVARDELLYSPKREQVDWALAERRYENLKGVDVKDDALYTGEICYSSGTKNIFAKPDLIVIAIDTRCDGNKFLMLLDPAKEVKR
jgi:hypothetical protein